MVIAYARLHEIGHAHSIERRTDEAPAGHLGHALFRESCTRRRRMGRPQVDRSGASGPSIAVAVGGRGIAAERQSATRSGTPITGRATTRATRGRTRRREDPRTAGRRAHAFDLHVVARLERERLSLDHQAQRRRAGSRVGARRVGRDPLLLRLERGADVHSAARAPAHGSRRAASQSWRACDARGRAPMRARRPRCRVRS